MTALEFDCDHTDDPVCPHCGYEETDIWEYHLGDGEHTVVNCKSCNGMFEVCASVSVTYSTTPTTELAEALDAARHQADVAKGTIRLFTHGGEPEEYIAPHRVALEQAQRLIAELEPRVKAETEAAP